MNEPQHSHLSCTADQDNICIEFDHVHFSYEGRDKTLSDLHFSVKEGEKVALVGSSGCGKSTVLKLIEGFFSANSGTIRIQGLDVEKWDLTTLRHRMALVLQDAFLFPGTLKDNIACGNVQTNNDIITEALKDAGLEEFLQQQGDGLNARVGERGQNLSGGQRQRITIARAMLRNAPILLLDEATSALDAQTEQEIQASMERLMQGRTTLIVSHRLATIRNADRILVLDGGCIVEHGSHDELMARGSIYSRLFSAQTGTFRNTDESEVIS